MRHAAIGIFDSGFGGLTVMHALKTLLPNEQIIYLGDTARLPYGEKSADTILKWSLEHTRFLQSLGIKLLVIACHSVCTSSFETLAQASPIPIVGVVKPSIEELFLLKRSEKIALIGTRRTVASGVYQKLIKEQLPFSELTAISCPLFVPLVEEGYIDHPITIAAVQEYLHPLKDKNIDALILGCTHYPLLEPLIQKELGPSVTLINPAICCAEQVRFILIEHDLLNDTSSFPQDKFYVSDDPDKFSLLGKRFLQYPIHDISLLNLI